MVATPKAPEKMISETLDQLMLNSDVGDALAHLYVLAAGPGAITPLGAVDESKIGVDFAIITPAGVEPEAYAAAYLKRLQAEKRAAGEQVLFAGLSQEVWLVPPEDWDEQAFRLRAQGRLGEHPKMVEVTMVYAAAADGRRWSGRRWLTGAQAGKVEAYVLEGEPTPLEGMGLVCAPVLRRLVGLSR